MTEEEQSDLDRLLAQMNDDKNAALPGAVFDRFENGEASSNDKVAMLAAMLVLYDAKLNSMSRALSLLHKKSKLLTKYLDYLFDCIDF